MGAHDENISFERMVGIVGAELANKVRDVSIRLSTGRRPTIPCSAASSSPTPVRIRARQGRNADVDGRGADAGLLAVLAGGGGYAEGQPASYDKQFVRDWLESVRIDGKPWGKDSACARCWTTMSSEEPRAQRSLKLD